MLTSVLRANAEGTDLDLSASEDKVTVATFQFQNYY